MVKWVVNPPFLDKHKSQETRRFFTRNDSGFNTPPEFQSISSSGHVEVLL